MEFSPGEDMVALHELPFLSTVFCRIIDMRRKSFFAQKFLIGQFSSNKKRVFLISSFQVMIFHRIRAWVSFLVLSCVSVSCQ